jgi:hypothetical protein
VKHPHFRRYGAFIALVVVMNSVIVWGQSNVMATADASLPAEMTVALKDMTAGCGRFLRSEHRYKDDVNEQRPSISGAMVAEVLRCPQCRGKCKAEELRCRSQCAGEGTCLANCEGRSSKCEAMCKQIFQCE